MTKRETATAIGLLIFRGAMGGLMLVHGTQKLMGFSKMAETFPDPIGLGSQTSLILAIAAEFGCSLLLIAGLLTRLAVIPLATTMTVALFIVHADDPWQEKELAAVFLCAFVALFFTGAGPFSLDHLIWGRKRDGAVKNG